VFEEVRRTDRPSRLVARPDADVTADGDRVGLVDLLGDDAEAATGPRQTWWAR
jgi:hypothetical protein